MSGRVGNRAHRGRILIVEDDPGTQRLLSDTLVGAGFAVRTAKAGQEALRALSQEPTAMVVLDLGLPDLDGMDVLRALRHWAQDMPVMVVSARGGEEDKVGALRAGADDFLAKPFGVDEFLARVEAHLRRAGSQLSDEPPVRLGDITVDLGAHRILRDGQALRLTPTELGVLRELIRHSGKVLTHREILIAVWGRRSDHEHGYVRTIVQRLRQKVESDPANPIHLLTVPAVGYIWQP